MKIDITHTALSIAVGAVLLLAGCDVKDHIYNTLYPDSGSITFAPTWDRTNIGQAPSEGYAPIFCTHDAELDFVSMPDGSYLVDPGECTVYLYTFLPGVNLNVDDPGNPLAMTWIDYDKSGFIVPDADFFYSGSAPVTVGKDKAQTVSVAMRQDVRELTLVIETTGETADKIETISGALSGVAGTYNLASGQHGTPSSVALTFAKNTDGKWKATVRLLGIVPGVGQKLTGTITFTDGNPENMSLESDLSTALSAFNDNKKEPLTLDGPLTETPSSTGFTGTIHEWGNVTGSGGTAD